MVNLKEEIKKVVGRDDVKYVIGYEKGTHGFRVSPCFAFNAEDVDKFIFSPLCANNLAVYLMLEEKLPLLKGEEDKRKMGIVVKGCDSRAVVQIIQEKGIRREDVVLLGVPCTGIIDPRKISARFPGQVEVVDMVEKDGKFVFSIDKTTHKILKEELIFDKCKHCEYPNPIIYDVLLGDKVETKKKEEYEKVKKLEKMSLEEKWKYWKEKFDRCVRCHACREVCPLCYCKECMGRQLRPQWLRRSVNLSENTAWNIMRAFHLAGRCVGCGECERACPMDIPLTELAKKLEKDVKEMFDHTPGMDVEGKPLLAMFKPDELGEVDE